MGVSSAHRHLLVMEYYLEVVFPEPAGAAVKVQGGKRQ